jgi:hypothetical protein
LKINDFLQQPNNNKNNYLLELKSERFEKFYKKLLNYNKTSLHRLHDILKLKILIKKQSL